MGRQKAKRFESNIIQENVIQEGKPLYENIKGAWNKEVFHNSNPIVLELGCGKGEYTVGLAKLFPDKNFIGIDIKGDRIAVGSQKAIEGNLRNVAFLRTKIHGLDSFFEENEVSEIWITFPDPQVLQSGVRRRLTNPRFLEIYAKILSPGGYLHLKTDSESFFKYSITALNDFGAKGLIETRDLYNSDLNVRHYNIKTRFEEIFTAKGFNINYLYCSF
ncbi:MULTISPECIES: tRNA (guanosine(46)-N7)-methyltransferase TrmB [unclassified Arcicella]|uniref:tRNA (guanosine(46)-N7)-methyltransferase TrmB n=1 Tax=unclassified Arcicella TaxID=2644986 RepID=UPI002856F7E9|nr:MULTISPECIES: tRNA (guanosine(46)-N7)-methyltransferase TrmB [unclassified Arcicella]MDR6561736.1 tRNA (guanine-N7-)-methyltransferase [Arcicella sp. BE51]MDR6812516.1 tRNA (guanine-N7-)-methyltransferase [Arcicella sp. BE140]MDR6823712.1 tRNA (guanine-N7-)-methyltransferase [Arcicella sp. BE139]